jgi:hypothetical protein
LQDYTASTACSRNRVEGVVVGRLVRTIRVRDGNGDQISIYECEYFERVPVLGLHRKLFRLELDSGEQVEQIDNSTYAVVQTGERLVASDVSKCLLARSSGAPPERSKQS